MRRSVLRRLSDFSWQTAALGGPGRRPATPAALQTAAQGAVTLHSGYPNSDLLPLSLVRAAAKRAIQTEALLVRPSVGGRADLQAWFAQEVAAQVLAGVNPPNPEDVLVVPGSQSGLCLAFSVLAGSQRPLVVESPTYWGALLAAQQTGVELVPIPSGPDGPDPEVLDRALADTGARAFYAQPTFASPTGALWGRPLSEAVLRVVRAKNAFVIEDDSARDFSLLATTPPPLAAMDDAGHVVYVRSLSKSTSPSLRVAAVIARGPVRDRLLAKLAADAMYVSAVLQDTALDVVRQPQWVSHLKQVRRDLVARRDLLVHCLAAHAPSVQLTNLPHGGLNLWVRLPDATRLDCVVRNCLDAGVIVGPGDEWFPSEPTGVYLRLNFASPTTEKFAYVASVIEAAVRQST